MAPRQGCFRLVAAFAYLLLLVCRAGAVEYVVGNGDFGWDSGVNYVSWAKEHTFAVGDVLVFQYVSSQHNVYEVTASTYRSCDAAGDKGVVAKYTSGFDKVALNEARSYWFICEFPGHCLGGMKLAVNVSANGAEGGGGGGAPSPTTNEPPPPSSNAAGGRPGWMAMGLALGVLLVLMNWAR